MHGTKLLSRSLAAVVALLLLWLRAPAARGFAPTHARARTSQFPARATTHRGVRRGAVNGIDDDERMAETVSGKGCGHRRRRRRRSSSAAAAASLLLLASAMGACPSPSAAAAFVVPSPSSFKAKLLSVLDALSRSGPAGMATYACSFALWTATVGMTTPIETAAGMAFPLKTAMALSATGKIGGALLQYLLAKYLFADVARRKLKNNPWMGRIQRSFEERPYRVALVWRFSPLPEFVKNVGPALVPALRTRTQALALLTHGLPFTALWSRMGSEAALLARGGTASVALKRMVVVVSWAGLVASPTLFGWWIKGLGEEEKVEGGERG